MSDQKLQKLRGQERNLKELYRVYKRRATKRKLPFTLPLESFRKITKSSCFICGQKPSKKYQHSLKLEYYKVPYTYNGIDRVANKKGYVEGNVAACCWKCNRAKGSLSLEQFMLHILKAYNHCIKPALTGDDDDVE